MAQVKPDSHLDPDSIHDIVEHHNKYLIQLKDGREIMVHKEALPRSLYWQIKLRNRRIAFGL